MAGDLNLGFRSCEQVIATQAHGQTVLLRLSDGSYYTLEGVGAAVWEFCDGLHGLEQIVDGVCERFDERPEIVRADVVAFLQELIDERLLERVA